VATRRDLHDTRLDIRVRKREMSTWKKAARRSDEPLSAWIRKGLNLLATPPLPQIPPVVTGDQLELSLPKTRKR
jgi:hypothetical protein